MKLVDRTLATPEQNLALDEALLDVAESSRGALEFLRLWEATAPVVVLGRSTQVGVEVNLARCHERDVPVLRRTSGGATIVAGPGCLMYAVVLSAVRRPTLSSLAGAHLVVLETLLAAIAPLVPGIARAGTSDLALGNRKFSGNSLRVKRSHVLYHGTLLYDFDLPLVADLLRTPPRVPDYRAGRSHEEFIANLPVTAETLRQALTRAWRAEAGDLDEQELTRRVAALVAEKYSRDAWNFAL
ncbi:MAG: lipoate--protein ligase family protein [Pirellulales bacterium]|nr:lipoate--protein ligase family protein [Pirellulales bacterium]